MNRAAPDPSIGSLTVCLPAHSLPSSITKNPRRGEKSYARIDDGVSSLKPMVISLPSSVQCFLLSHCEVVTASESLGKGLLKLRQRLGVGSMKGLAGGLGSLDDVALHGLYRLPDGGQQRHLGLAERPLQLT